MFAIITRFALFMCRQAHIDHCSSVMCRFRVIGISVMGVIWFCVCVLSVCVVSPW